MKHHRLPALELCPTSRVSSSWMVGSRFWAFADWPSGLDCFQGVIGFRQAVSSRSPWCWFFPSFFTHHRACRHGFYLSSCLSQEALALSVLYGLNPFPAQPFFFSRTI